jgi:deoxyribose-phosphate aldolase
MNADIVTGAAGVVAAGLASPGITGAGGTGTAAIGSDAALRQILHGLPGVDQVGAQERAASLATRSIKREAKLWALETAVRMVDLTTLEGADTPGKVRGLCAKARHPDPDDPSVPPVAAVCVYPDLVALARAELAGSEVAVASVATAFPSGRASLAVKLADVADAVDAGADEVDMVIDRGAFLAGRYAQVYEEVRAVREACGAAHLKVILETAELATLDNTARASWLAMLAGADFIKTSTGKVRPPPRHRCAGDAVRGAGLPGDGRRVGVKVAGGIRTARTPSATWCWSARSPGQWLTRSCSASAPPACSTTCSCSAASSSPAPTPVPTTSPSISSERRPAHSGERYHDAGRGLGVRPRAGVTRDRDHPARVRPVHRRGIRPARHR